MSFCKSANLWIVFIVAAAFFTSCTPVKPCKVTRVVSFSIAESKGFGITINTELELDNPNRSSLTIKKTDIDVFVEGVFLGKLIVPENLTIPANKVFLTHLQIDVSFNSLLTAGRGVLKKIQSKSFEVTFKGSLDVHYLFFNKVLLIDTTNKVEL
jgi:LEA14-like dessication related protein